MKTTHHQDERATNVIYLIAKLKAEQEWLLIMPRGEIWQFAMFLNRNRLTTLIYSRNMLKINIKSKHLIDNHQLRNLLLIFTGWTWLRKIEAVILFIRNSFSHHILSRFCQIRICRIFPLLHSSRAWGVCIRLRGLCCWSFADAKAPFQMQSTYLSIATQRCRLRCIAQKTSE